MTPEGITEVINNTRTVSKDVAVLLDTKGPEVRTTVLSGNSEYKAQHGKDLKIEFKPGDKVTFMANPDAEV